MKLVRMLRRVGVRAVLVGGLACGFGAAVLATSSVSVAQSSITVQGNRRVEADTIRSYFRTQPGERLDAVKIDEAYKALIATGLFEDVRISQAGGRLTVTVVEAPVINRVAFEGNRRIKDEIFLQEMQSKSRGTFSRPMVQADVQRILDVYRAQGRYDVRVDPKIIELPNGRVDLVFEITEGQKTTVKEINFVGNRAYSAGRLKDVIKTNSTGILSFIKGNDLYDPDRLEADRDLLRRFYLKHGYADVRIVSAVAEFDSGRNGFIVTFTIEEGDLYRFGNVDVRSNVRDVDPATLRARIRGGSGSTYNAEGVEKTVEDMSIELAKRGYAFSQVRPTGDRDFAGRLVNVTYVVEEGPRAYIERINIRGNTRTRDYVIRREFDIAEGDAYNRALVDRAERRLKNLAYFKTVKFTSEPGSAPDRIILNVDVEEQSTGEFAVAGGYSTADGWLAEISVGERNLLGRGQYLRGAVQYGQRAQGFEVSFVEPYLMGYRVALGLDVFAKLTSDSQFVSYESRTVGGAIRVGLPLNDEWTLSPRYSAYEQRIELPYQFNNCVDIKRPDCLLDGEASLAVREAVLAGPQLVSLVGYSLTYNTLDSNRSPTSGIYAELKQDFAGVGGDVNFVRTTGDARYYHEVMPDLIALGHVQAGHITVWGGNENLRMLDNFFMGPNLVRGFAPAGMGPRDLTPGTSQDAVGGTLYWGASIELQHPLFFAPKDFGIRAAVFADAGSLWDYNGIVTFAPTGESFARFLADSSKVRSSVGAGLIWDSPFGPLRFDYAFALSKEPYDRVQEFRFSGGTKF